MTVRANPITMTERRTSTLLRALAIGVVTLQLSWSVESIVAHGARHNQLEMTGDVYADYKAYMKLNPDLKRDSTRFEFFKRNYERILAHDAEKAGYTIGLTKFTGYTDEELALMSNNRLNDAADDFTGNTIMYFDLANENMAHPVQMDDNDIPASYNLSALGLVSPVKDQGNCGSCYAFAATAAVDTAYAIKTKTVVDFAAQQYVACTKGYGMATKKWQDCDKKGNCVPKSEDIFINGTKNGNDGCNGGNFVTCWYYHNRTGHNLHLETCYPYTAGQRGKVENCKMPTSCSTGAAVCGYLRLPKDDIKALKWAIFKHGPAACTVVAKREMQDYTGGVFSYRRSTSDHAVTVVGYSQTSDGTDYWIVKNSWGTRWGLNGYIWINGDNVNDAGLTSSCAVPILCGKEDSSSSD